MNITKFSDEYSYYLFYTYTVVSYLIYILLLRNAANIPSTLLINSLVLITFLLLNIKNIKFDFNFFLVILFLIYCYSLILINYISGDLIDSMGRSITKYHLILCTSYLISYLFGRYSKFKISTISYVMLALMIASTITLVNLSNFALDLALIDAEKRSIYLILSDLMVLYLIFLISKNDKNIHSILLFIIGCAVLFILNSRSSLYAFIIVFLLNQALYTNIKTKIFALITSVLGFGLFLTSEYFEVLLEKNPRMLSIITGLERDESKIARDNLLQVGLGRTLDSPIKGDYGGVISESGSIGSYIHSILSYWQTFGLIPFIIVVYLLVLQPIYIAYKSYRNKEKPGSNIAFNLAIYTVLLLAISKSYTWHYAWFIMGYLHVYMRQVKQPLRFE